MLTKLDSKSFELLKSVGAVDSSASGPEWARNYMRALRDEAHPPETRVEAVHTGRWTSGRDPHPEDLPLPEYLTEDGNY
jgi:hypothetical protein